MRAGYPVEHCWALSFRPAWFPTFPSDLDQVQDMLRGLGWMDSTRQSPVSGFAAWSSVGMSLFPNTKYHWQFLYIFCDKNVTSFDPGEICVFESEPWQAWIAEGSKGVSVQNSDGIQVQIQIYQGWQQQVSVGCLHSGKVNSVEAQVEVLQLIQPHQRLVDRLWCGCDVSRWHGD